MITGVALELAIGMITKECGGKTTAFTNTESRIANPVIKYDPKFFKQRVGFEIPEKTQKEILEKLGYEIAPERSEGENG
jgi:phenylalanyl-tRNA synthetase beta subunit